MVEMIIVVTLSLIAAYRLGFCSNRDKGRRGERRVRRILRPVCRKGGFRLLNDIYIKSCGREAQIDHVLIGRSGVFVIETKNYDGRIDGTSDMKEWTQTVDGKESTFYNPLWQNWGHISALRDLLGDVCPEKCFHSLVVFPHSMMLHTDSLRVIGRRQLRMVVLSEREDVLSENQMKAVADAITAADEVSRAARRRYVRSIRRKLRKESR